MRLTACLLLLSTTAQAAMAAEAGSIPACALSGSMTMTINGRPALRLSDVAQCPPALYEVLEGISLDGQPMVSFKTGSSDDTDCTATADPTVSLNGKPANRLGDVKCTNR